ncbi:MAG: AAA family ATPase [Candidatus Poribacteria bacterium]|nr:AAA family ATPase [Candidatus Poribacteria bacterium]
MKICKLKLKNLNSFRGEQEIDFESGSLSDASLVAITGPTGAGKTTLLDAICVALYGKTPRLSGTTSQHPRHLISHGETEGFAEVYFEANNRPYHATWSIKRNGAPKGQLFDDSGKSITTKVAQEVASILGLDFNAFKRSVMLAQGEFAAFLKASKEDRRTILEATAGIHIYDLLRQALNEKIHEVEGANTDVLDKLNKIPEASHEQLTEAETELDNLQMESEALGEQSQQIQQEKDRETKRKEDSEKLQSSEKRQVELLNLQPEVDALQVELENAQRAKDLRSEKREYDTAELDLEKAKEALDTATTGKTDAEKQVKAGKTDFDEKEEVYQAASTEHREKTAIYNAAKLDVNQAKNQFAEAEKRESRLVNLRDQIDALNDQLFDRQAKQTELQDQIDDAQCFLEDNPLPSDRQQRLTRTTRLLEQLRSQEKQLQTELTNKANAEKNGSSLKQEIENLSNVRQECLSKKTEAEATFENTTTHLNKLLATGTHEEWTDRKQQASKAQPIAEKYEATQDDLADAKNQLSALNDIAAAQDAELEQIEAELATQTEVCQRAAATVRHCEAERESVILANPINQLRQHLHTGEPCLVCGATEHPSADIVEPKSEERLQRVKETLAAAKTDADVAQSELQILKTKQIRTEQNKCNTADQIETCTAQIGTLHDKASTFLAEWQAIYPNADVSSKWASKQFDIADTTIADITEAEQRHTEASNALQIVSQQLKTYENDIKRETNDLNDIETQLKNLSNAIADRQADIAATETRFWESMPDSFHGVDPGAAVKQFNDKIEEVGQHEIERDGAKTQLQVLNANIEADRDRFQDLKDNREDLKTDIDKYRSEGEACLEAARQKTGGLEAETEIDAAIDTLETELQMKAKARDNAEQRFQNSQKLLTQKQTTHGHCEGQYEESSEKLETARETYFKKLSDVGFDSPEAHNNAFRNDAQIHDLTDQIDTHEDEKQTLELVITELRNRFQENPFNPETLEAIETQVREIEAQFQTKLEERGAQQQRIDDLKKHLKQREALGSEVAAAEAEVMRWKRLQDTIPRNDLRDFALEIMFRQMGSLANDQLRYLTSERYQLKVEGIGDLTVIDRWNANEERPVETLSGGESFLTSLALALALADLSRGRAQLNSLFLDEGFGTLDTETLDVAIAALEGLRMQGRSIFLISHIQELTRRLPVKINVRKRGNGSSSIDIRG